MRWVENKAKDSSQGGRLTLYRFIWSAADESQRRHSIGFSNEREHSSKVVSGEPLTFKSSRHTISSGGQKIELDGRVW